MIKRMCGLDWHQFFLTNKNRNTITRATKSPRVSLEFHVPFDYLFIRWHLTFCLQRIFILFMLCEGGFCWIQIQNGVRDFVVERTYPAEHFNLSKSGFVSEEGHSGCKSQNTAIRALKANVLCKIWFKWTHEANLVNWWGSSKNKFAFRDHNFTRLAAARWQDSMSRVQKSWTFCNFPHWFFVHFWTM